MGLKLEFIKYRKFENITFEFNKNINIIAGVNGTCKSSLLYVISNSFKKIDKNFEYLKDKQFITITNKITKEINPKLEKLVKNSKYYNDPAKNTKGILYNIISNNKLGFRKHNSKKANIYQVVTGEVPASNAVQSTIFKNLFLIPGSVDVSGLSIELVNENNRELLLKTVLESLDADYDFILMDCCPSLGLETMNALVWADSIIIPLQCEYFAMEGLNLLMRTITNIRKELNPNLRVLGILFTMYKKRALLNEQVVEDITQFFGDMVFKTIIPRNVRLAEAPSHGLPINYYDKSSKGSKAFADLALEVIDRA